MSRSIMIMAGGTGGHIFPALAVAEHLRAQGWSVTWLGVRGGMEERIIPARGYAMAWVRFSGVRGRGVAAALLLPLNLLVAFWQAARAIFAHRPDIVLGMGGYVSFPGAMMASFLTVMNSALRADVLALGDHQAQGPALVAGTGDPGPDLRDPAQVGARGHRDVVGDTVGIEVDLHGG